MLTEAEIKKYKEDGILVLKGMVPQDKLQSYRDAYERMLEKVHAHPDRKQRYRARMIGNNTNTGAGAADGKEECWGADFLLHPELYEKEFTDYLESERLINSLKCLLGPELEVYGIKAIWSPATVTYDLSWHRDGKQEVYSKDGLPPGWLQWNTALYREESFRVVRGSHLRPLTDEENAKYGTVEDVADMEICVLEPGDALFMHQAVLHRGKADPTNKRRALHYILASTDFAVGTRRLKQFKGWYDELNFEEKLGPQAKELFKNFFAWEGRTFDDVAYKGKEEY